MLGEFDYLILAAAAALGEKAYSPVIRAEIENATRRNCSIGALYATIASIESKGLLQSWMGEATGERAGQTRGSRHCRKCSTIQSLLRRKAVSPSCRSSGVEADGSMAAAACGRAGIWR
jgi:hypothetical protein